jgi:hypothetical protein
MILGQGGIKMILVDRDDHRVHFVEGIMLKGIIELIL